MLRLFRKLKTWVQGQPVANPANHPKGRKIVLVAEDDAILRTHMVSTLTELGYRVVEAADGEEALHISQETLAGKIDLLLTDIVMPKMSGRQLAYLIGKVSPLTKVILCSGYPEKLAAGNGMIDHTTPFLQKPVSPEALAFKVREVLDELQSIAPRHLLT